MVDLATKLIDSKTARFDAAALKDHYADMLRAFVSEKLKGNAIIAPPEQRPSDGNVIDLMEALKRSIGEPSRARQARASSTSKRPRKKG